ncbi:hypothetical protein GY45DRAFT_945972 [Cubamyces sp. BRFM 1775]|nr:hypothetical protein GY45DRAFT_945972 [Cubamyces sp. BRFM 1775]
MFSDLSALWLLQSFNAKLLALYNHHYTPDHDGINGECAGAAKAEQSALEVCSLLRTFKSCREPLDIDFDPPQLVCSSSPGKYLLIVNLRALRSPSRCHPFRAIRTFEVSYVHQTYRWAPEGHFPGPTSIDMHTLALQDAELRLTHISHNDMPSGKAAISEESLSGILKEYMERLHEGGLSTFIAQACPSVVSNGRVTPRPQSPLPATPNLCEQEFNVYVRVLWRNIVTNAGPEGHSLEHVSGKSGNSLSFDRPPTVRYIPQSREVWFCFQGSLNSVKSNTKFSAVWFSVGTLVTSERQGVLIASRIDKDGFRAACKNPDVLPNGPFKSTIISMIRDEYIPLLWRYGFDVLRTTLDWTTIETIEPRALSDGTTKDFHEPRMNSWDFAVSISQTSINANLAGNAMTHTFPWALEWKSPSHANGGGSHKAKNKGRSLRPVETFTATFTMSRIQLLSDGQAILWVQVCPEDQDCKDEGEQPETGSTMCRLAFHVSMKMRLVDESATAPSVWKIYLDTANLLFLPQYSTLPFPDRDVDGKYGDLVNFITQTYLPSLVKNNGNVIARVPILNVAAKSACSSMQYAKFHTTFGRRGATAKAITVEDWFNELQTLSPALLVYGTPHKMDGALAIPPSWNWSPRLDDKNRLSVGTLAFGKEAFIEDVMLTYLARLNEITALVPTSALAYKSSCPHEEYLRSSGDGVNATAALWKRCESHLTDDTSTRAYVFERTTSCVEEMIIDSAIQKKTLCECKTNNKLIISDLTSPELTVTMTGEITLIRHHGSKGDTSARLTWEWEIIRCTGTDSNVEIASNWREKLLGSVKTNPGLDGQASSSYSCDKGPAGTSVALDRPKAARILEERLRDKFRDVVQNATLLDPLAIIRDAVAARGDFLLGDTIRCNDNSDLLIDLYPKANTDAHADLSFPDADADVDLDVDLDLDLDN